MTRAEVVVDLSTSTATVVRRGRVTAAYGPGVTRRSTAAVLAASGYRLDPAGEWSLTSPPDGFRHPLIADRPPLGERLFAVVMFPATAFGFSILIAGLIRLLL